MQLDIHVQPDQQQKVIVQNVQLVSIQQKEQHAKIAQQENIRLRKDHQLVQHAMLVIIQQQDQQNAQNVLLEHINQVQKKEVVLSVIHCARHVIISMEIV